MLQGRKASLGEVWHPAGDSTVGVTMAAPNCCQIICKGNLHTAPKLKAPSEASLCKPYGEDVHLCSVCTCVYARVCMNMCTRMCTCVVCALVCVVHIHCVVCCIVHAYACVLYAWGFTRGMYVMHVCMHVHMCICVYFLPRSPQALPEPGTEETHSLISTYQTLHGEAHQSRHSFGREGSICTGAPGQGHSSPFTQGNEIIPSATTQSRSTRFLP